MMLMNTVLKHKLARYHLFRRFKHKESLAYRKKKTACDRALDHFDEFYSEIFAANWSSIRQGLLSKQKYVAVINNFSDVEETKTKLERIGALNIRTLFEIEKENIRDNYQKLRRKRRLEKIWRSAEEFGKGSNEADTKATVEDTQYSHSLEQNLAKAQMDFSRLISSENALNLSEFMPVTKLKGKEDWISESERYDDNDDRKDFSVSISQEYDIHFPQYLNVYCYEISNHNDFSPPKNGTTGVLNYYLMDGGSLLPVLALDLKPGDHVLDMCASPGGKSYLALQTLYPDRIVCNDISKSRTDRIYGVMKQYLYDLDERWLGKKKLHISQHDGRIINEDGFDKIIVDVPCTTDRHSLKEPENNIFRPDRVRERLKLPELQSELLVQALKLVKIGGNVVYSTCSLSPVQNDGVVHMALKRIWEETSLEITVKDLSVALLQTANVYKLADGKVTKYGHLVVPNLQINFGPTYFCKLQRIK